MEKVGKLLVKYYPVYLSGLWGTLWISAVTVLFGALLGVLVALMRMSRFKLLRGISKAYIEVLRGTPILLQLYFFWIGLPKLVPFELSDTQCIVAALAVKGTAGTVVTLTRYSAGVEAFGEDAAAAPGMSTLLKLLFQNGASTVEAVRVDEAGDTAAYQAAFAALADREVQVMVCDSSDLAVQKALKAAVEAASGARKERIGVIGGSGDTAAELVTRAAAINSERMVLVGPDMKDENGTELPGVFAAAAVAGAIAAGTDPALPLNGAALYGIGGLQADYGDNDIDLMVRGGVTPLECVGGTVSPVRGITTRTKTGSAADATWRELTTVLVADDVIPAVRAALRSKFARAKNTAQGRGAIRAQTIVELEKKKSAQIIEDYGEVTVTASADDPTVCLVEFGFAVAHGLNQIYLTVHLTV